MIIFKSKLQFITIFFILCSPNIKSQNELNQIHYFGSNPGNLKLMFYDPGNINEKAPLVVVLHGCSQTAESCAEQSGWNKLAKLHQFYVLYPEQSILNNIENCFNWYRAADQNRDKGEPASIMQMIQLLKKEKNIDSTRIYIIGLSAGGAMSSIMMAVFPEVFDKGGVMAGGPYKSAESIIKAGPSMLGMITKTAEKWGDLIRKQNPNYSGPYPELVVFHGDNDHIVNINNSDQLIKQWINIHHLNIENAERQKQFNNYGNVELTLYKNNQNHEIIRYYKLANIGHALPIDTGKCSTQGGKTGVFAINNEFHSTFWAAHFFELIKPPYIINGEKTVKPYTSELKYDVPIHSNSTYSWTVSNGMNITNGKSSHLISLNVSNQSGFIEIIETDINGCKLEPCKLWIEVKE